MGFQGGFDSCIYPFLPVFLALSGSISCQTMVCSATFVLIQYHLVFHSGISTCDSLISDASLNVILYNTIAILFFGENQPYWLRSPRPLIGISYHEHLLILNIRFSCFLKLRKYLWLHHLTYQVSDHNCS
jgi:hypothetical protein